VTEVKGDDDPVHHGLNIGKYDSNEKVDEQGDTRQDGFGLLTVKILNTNL
jgi:hypothetical protein